ncbi:MAG: dihydroorotate dehydrogenase [Planctomycetota bacterium]|jgi:dihydroorotate dehydrogenase (NAD+) catalytic subunit
MQNRLFTDLGKLTLNNPVLTASGTFGSGIEYEDFVNLNSIGGIVTKSVSLEPRKGNPPPRIAETPSGMLNSIGLQNEGVEHFCRELLPPLRDLKTKIIVSVAGKSMEDYLEVTRRLAEEDIIDALEINVSCPNVKEGGMAFGVCAGTCGNLVKELKELTDKYMLVKLSPNVTDIKPIAKAIEDAGADALVVANTLLGMAVDIEKRKPIMANIMGGLSGPAIKPVALRLVWQVAKCVNIPIIGCGGIASAEDIVEFLLCGASAVEVGTMNFVYPDITERMVRDLDKWLAERNETVAGITGTLEESI